MKSLTDALPEFSKQLTEYTGIEIISRLGEHSVKEVINGILHGKNVRSLTEGLTRKRIASCSAGVLKSYISSSQSIENFSENIVAIAGEEYNQKNRKYSKAEKMYLLWLMGLTTKGVQNILRGDADNALNDYVEATNRSLQEAVIVAKNGCGELSGQIILDGETMPLNWITLTQLFTVIGAQTLAIRGSEKSMYGKLFEKLVLGSLLTFFGFRMRNNNPNFSDSMIYWLSQREDKRESDATVIVSQTHGMRFDIGFIGPGNSEISLDKVSRFERQMEFGHNTLNMGVIVLIDRIGSGSRIATLAKKINGHIIQMSHPLWVKQVANILHTECGFNHPILNMNDETLVEYITHDVMNIDIKQFLSADLIEAAEDTGDE